jgi:carbon-monoxide dehydrogenase large subunit
VRIEAEGHVVVYTGACPQGQGHHTSLAQVCCNELGIPIEMVKVVSGDTSLIQDGFGTFASRSAVTAGNAVAAASRAVLQQVRDKLAAVIECPPDDVHWRKGWFEWQGKKIELSEALARLKRHDQVRGAPGVFPIEGLARFETQGHTFAAGAHGAVVEVDTDAGTIQIIQCAAAHETGSVINPMIVEGQLHGGVAHGIGNTLLERIAYDENGSCR